MTISKASTSKTQYTTPISDVPNPPTIDSVSSTGVVAFTLSEKGGTPTTFTVTSNPGNYTNSGASSPINMETSGISDNTSYTYSIVASNTTGNSTTVTSDSTLMTLLPAVPTGISASVAAGHQLADVSFTPGVGGRTPTSYRAISTPGNITATGSSSPIRVTGLTGGVSYTFTVRAQAPALNSAESSASNSVTPTLPSYSLSQTFTSSGTYTVPAGMTQIAVVGNGAGGAGAGGSVPTGGTGGGSGGGFILKDYAVSPGQTFAVTIGSSGGVTSFGSLITANSGATGGGGGNVTSNVTLEVNVAGSSGAGGGNSSTQASGNSGGTGTSRAAISGNAPGIPSYSFGGSGGGGGGGGNAAPAGSPERFGANGGSGGTPNGGGGGHGGRAFNTSHGPPSAGQSGNAAGGTGGGGGGGGGGAFNGSANSSAGGGGAGSSGRILVYAR